MDDRTRHEHIAHVARELAQSGQCKDIIEIEVGLILKDFGEAHEILKDPALKAELEMLCEDMHSSQPALGFKSV